MDKIEAVMRRFPQHVYDPENTQSSLYKLIKAILVEFDTIVANINRVDAMIGIDTIHPDDLEGRFGKLLNIPRNRGESDEQYRNRLRTALTSLSGGTADAIKYAIACGLGINNNPEEMEKIQVYDAWEYPGDAEVNTDYGYIVCTIDLNNGEFSTEKEDIIMESANSVKAAGTIIQFLFNNYRIVYYKELDKVTYISLNAIEYNKVGG